MNIPLVSAAVLAIAIGAVHSILGERYLIRPILRRTDLPRLFGDDSFTRQTLRYGWHLVTVAWFGLAAVMLVISGARPTVRVGDGVVFAIALTFLVNTILAVVVTRGRHLSWVVFAAMTALCLLAVR
jgi:hypothetical protein